MQTHPANPLTETALSTLRSDLSNAMACYLTSFSGASAPTSPTPENGRVWYDSANHTVNFRINAAWAKIITSLFANFGTTTKANATGDLAAGLTGSYAMSWDVATGTLKIYDVSDAVKVSLDSAGFFNLGGATAATARGDFATLGATHRMEFDESAGTLVLNLGTSTRVRLDTSGAGVIGVLDANGVRASLAATDGSLSLYDSSIVRQHSIAPGGVAFNETLIDADFTISGNDREVFSVDAGDNSVEITGMLRNVPQSATIASGTLTITSSYVVMDTEGAAATDDLVTIAAGTGVVFRAGNRILLRQAAGTRDITVKDAAGNIYCVADKAMTNAGGSMELLFDGTNWIMTHWVAEA